MSQQLMDNLSQLLPTIKITSVNSLPELPSPVHLGCSQNGKTPTENWVCERNPASNRPGADEIPGTTSNGQPAATNASISEVERPK